MSARDALRATQQPTSTVGTPGRWDVLYDEKGRLLCPELADRDDIAGHCAWLTSVFNLDSAHPITGGSRQGVAGPEGHAALSRADAPEIRFEPVTRVNTPARLIETLSWQLTRTDGAVHALKAEHCREIAFAIRMLCSASEAMTAAQEVEAVIGTFLHGAAMVEGHTTYGTAAQRYEAAIALRREIDETTGRPIGSKYLVDSNTGELVIGVADLQEAARRHTGSGQPRGWLDGRIDALGWDRIVLQGYGLPGRAGRTGPHARINAYRGVLRSAEVEPETDHSPVNT